MSLTHHLQPLMDCPRWLPLQPGSKAPREEFFHRMIGSLLSYDAAMSDPLGDGAGFKFLDCDPFVCIDIDADKETGALSEDQTKLLEWLSGTGAYVERSRSGKGFHIVGIVDEATKAFVTDSNFGGVEVYLRDHYVIMTGDYVSGAVMTDISEPTQQVFSTYKAQRSDPIADEIISANFTALHKDVADRSDAEVLDRCNKNPNFVRAWNGDGNSENDMVIVDSLVFHSRNVDQVRRMWVESPCAAHRRAHGANKDKLDRIDYLKRCITKGWDAHTLTAERKRQEMATDNGRDLMLETYYPLAVKSLAALFAGQEEEVRVEVEAATSLSPSGVVAEPEGSVAANPPAPILTHKDRVDVEEALTRYDWMQQVLSIDEPWQFAVSSKYTNSIYRKLIAHMDTLGDPRKRLPDASVLSAFAYFGPVWGHSSLAGSQNASLFAVIVAETGAGKSLPMDGPRDVISQVSYTQLQTDTGGLYATAEDVRLLHEDYTAGDAYSVRGVANTIVPADWQENEEKDLWQLCRRNKMFAKDEVGLKLADIVENDKHGFKGLLLSLTGGQDGVMTGSSMANRGDKVPHVTNIAFTYFGATTPETTIRLTSQEMIDAGMVNRLSLTWDKKTFRPDQDKEQVAEFDPFADEGIIEHKGPSRNPMKKQADPELLHRIRAYRMWAADHEFRRDDPSNPHNGAQAHFSKDAHEMMENVRWLFEVVSDDPLYYSQTQKKAVNRSDTMVEKYALILALGEMPLRDANESELHQGKYVVNTNSEHHFVTRGSERMPVIHRSHVARAFGIVWRINELKLKLVEDNLARTETRASKEVQCVVEFLDWACRNAAPREVFHRPATRNLRSAPFEAHHFPKYGILTKQSLVSFLKKQPAFGDAHNPTQRVEEVLTEFEDCGALELVTKESVAGLTGAKRLKAEFYYRFGGQEKLTAVRI